VLAGGKSVRATASRPKTILADGSTEELAILEASVICAKTVWQDLKKTTWEQKMSRVQELILNWKKYRKPEKRYKSHNSCGHPVRSEGRLECFTTIGIATLIERGLR
jgi:hypothetical protein